MALIKPDMIPDEVVEAAAKADYEAWRDYVDLRDETLDWGCLEEEEREGKRICALAAIAAALSAWPEVKRVKGYFTHDTDYYEPAIILPLPQEPRDEWTNHEGSVCRFVAQ